MIDSLSAAVSETATALAVQPVVLSSAASTASNGAAAAAPASQPATRLMIEPDGAQGYVYRLVDVATGRLLVELPRERVEEVTAHSSYAAGALLSTSA